MPSYRYKGRNRRGELIEGTIDSPSAQAVAAWMLDTSVFPVRIDLEKPPKETPPWLARLLHEDQVTAVDIESFTRQLSTLLRAGLPLLRAIQSLQRSTTHKGLTKVLRAITEDLDKGAPLSKALARHPQVFGDYYLSMVRVGEDSGQQGEVLLALQRQLEFDRQMRQKVATVMRYPVIVMLSLVVATFILLMFVIPVFASIYQTIQVDLPLVTRALIALSNGVVHFWWAILGLMALVALAVGRWLKTPQGRYTWDRIKLRLPLVGAVVSKGAIGRFCESFSTAYRSGVPIVHAFELVSRIVDNAFIKARVLQMRHGLERGDSFSRVARSAGIFNQTELQMIIVGEETGDIEKMVSQIARMHQEEVDYDVHRLSKSMEPILLGLMGLLVGLLLLGIFTPLWDLGQMNTSRG